MHWQLPRAQFIGFGLIIVLVGVLEGFAVFQLKSVLTNEALHGREAQASLTATVLRERFDRFSDLALATATRVPFQQAVAAGRWDDAIGLTQPVIREFPLVDRIILNDTDGVLRADIPAAPGVRGLSFAHRDWYQGVTARNATYVSNVYERTAEPPQKVIAVAVPVRSPGDPSVTLAYLVLQVRLDTLLAWAMETDYGPDAFAIFVDRIGTLAAHPKFDPQGDIVDYSAVPWVQEASRDDHGIGIYDDPLIEEDESLIAYTRVPGYDWTVGISQSESSAFAVRDRLLTRIGIVFAVIVVLIVLLIISVAREFARLQAAKNEFVVTATHQLKTPLVGLRWTLDSLRIPPERLTEQQRIYLANMKRFGEIMVRSVDELLDISRIELGTLRLEMEPIDLPALLKRLVSDLAYYASTRGHTVELAIAASVPTMVTLDAKMVYHVLQNLVSNALDYSLAGTPVEIQAALDGSEVRVEVKNQGSPIPLSVQHNLFQKFYRAPQAKRVKAAGTGIGLYIAKSFTERWGGRIGLVSSDAATVFWFTIPIQPNVRPGDLSQTSTAASNPT